MKPCCQLSWVLGRRSTRLPRIFGCRKCVWKCSTTCVSAISVNIRNPRETRVGLHSANLVSRPMDRLFVDFVDPLVRSNRGNIAFLFVANYFSKSVSLCRVRKITSQAVSDYLEREYFQASGTPKSIVTNNARVFCCKDFKDLYFR